MHPRLAALVRSPRVQRLAALLRLKQPEPPEPAPDNLGSPRPPENTPSPPRPPLTRLQRLALAFALLYALALAATALLLRYEGEDWWVTAALLYAPRLGFLLPLPLVACLLALTRQWRPLITSLIVDLTLGAIVTGFVLPTPHAADAGPKLRVLTFNVNSCAAGVDRIVAVVDHYAPDIVMLEELGQREPLLSQLRARYPDVRTDTQFLVATRFPMTAWDLPAKVSYNGRARSARWVRTVMETPLGAIAFFVVHPISPREGLNALRGDGFKKELLSGRLFKGTHKDILVTNVGLRALQVADVAAAAKLETLPVVIAGDTNLPVLSKVFGRNLSSYQDGFVKAGSGFGYSFPSAHPWMRIDRILASDALRFVGFEVGLSTPAPGNGWDGDMIGGETASDHDCVVADLQRAR